jgi:hypothetical protein
MSARPGKWIVLAAICATVAATGDARAITSHSGRDCKAYADGTGNNMVFSPGIGNNAWSSPFTQVECPLSLGTQTSGCVPVAGLVVRYSDANATEVFSCSAEKYSFDGLALFMGPPRYTCSQAGGCPDSTTSFVGSGYLQLTISGSATSNCIDQDYAVGCVIPSKVGHTVSHIFSYWAN